MNCPQCGCHIVEHGLAGCHGLLDDGEACRCTVSAVKIGEHYLGRLTAAEIERDAWKREALAAREILNDALAVVHPIGSKDSRELERLWDAYLAARVPDEKEQEA